MRRENKRLGLISLRCTGGLDKAGGRTVPPRVRRQGDEHKWRDILDLPDGRRDEGVDWIDQRLVPEKDWEEEDADDQRSDGLGSEPEGRDN